MNVLEPILESAKQNFADKAPEEVQGAIFRQIREQRQSGVVYGLREGQTAPDFTLPDALGASVNLYEQLARGPVVLTFYRGGWCPFCNLQLRAYQSILPDIEAAGARLIALSPQRPDRALAQRDKEELRFPVLSDTNGQAAAGFRVLFEVQDYIQDIMTNRLQVDLTDYNGVDRWILPIPSTFVIDRSGVVRYAYVDPDFMRRMEPQDILEQLARL